MERGWTAVDPGAFADEDPYLCRFAAADDGGETRAVGETINLEWKGTHARRLRHRNIALQSTRQFAEYD